MATTKSKSYALNGGHHTAGIFADMSVDGPQIGTLVMVVDRAKNLPNRKTIGKQDPYCAARLGKEAKKTATDIRGGQTPKWDQELRFTVHDSPDYYQLKISVFTDDKKTDLIGDAWIDLKGIVVPGGGQSDMWQSLSCKGKYAGEIRVEITYYDARPKPDKPAARRRQPPPPLGADQDAKPRTPVKRRPLPSDPITGEAPSPPAAAPQPAGHASPEHLHQTPPRPHAFVPTQSPLQAVEYNTPPAHAARQQHPADAYSPSSLAAGASPGRVDGPRPVQRARETAEPSPRHHAVSPYEPASPRGQPSPLSEHHEPYHEPYHEVPLREEPRSDSRPPDDGCPPPPPAHRSMPGGDGQELAHRGAYDTTPQKTAPSTPMRHEVLRNEAHRHPMPTYPGRPTFRPYVPPSPSNPPEPHGASPPLDPSPPPRYHSYDPFGDAQHRSMQATVEDAPESPPTARDSPHGHAAARSASHSESVYDAPRRRPESMDLVRSPPGSSARHSTYSPGRYQDGAPPEHSKSLTYPPPPGQGRSPRGGYEPSHARKSPRYALPDVPASLSPGLDPSLSREISEQIHDERRHDARYASPPVATPTRIRHKTKAASVSYSPYSSGYVPRSYEVPEAAFSGAPESQLVRRGDVSSPSAGRDGRQAIRRKSVSPGLPPAEDRLLAEVPFGPDSYDALNPGMGAGRDARLGNEQMDASGKIITHDGREVDPSDHLPMESWAPEPEPKQAAAQPSPEPRPRPSPLGAQPMPPSGRRPLSIAAIPSSVSSPSAYKVGEDPHTPAARGSAGRGRLRKKINRGPSAPASAGSSPLAPVSADRLQGRPDPYMLASGRRRWGSWDYSGENDGPQRGAAPPIPAKIALPMMSGGDGPGDVALMREMQGIDIGSGRSRRRGGH